MNKTFTASLAAITVLASSALAAQLAHDVVVPTNINGEIVKKHLPKKSSKAVHKVPAKVVGDVTFEDDFSFTSLFEETFSKFTEGSETAPVEAIINDEEGSIDQKYFENDGWSGLGVHQAGGVAYLTYQGDLESDDCYYGMLSTPAIAITTPVRYSMRVRAEKGNVNNSVTLNVQVQDDDDSYTMDGWEFYIDEEWQEVRFVTSYTGSNCRFYVFPKDIEQGIYVDYVKVESVQLEGAPILFPETNVTDNSFTINWKDSFGYYDIAAYATHTAKQAETYTLMDADFSTIDRGDCDIEDPDFDDDYDWLYPDLQEYSGILGWTLQYPKYITGAICLDGEWTEYGDYSAIVSPSLDLSHNGGKVKLSIKTKGFPIEGERFNIQLLTLENGAWHRKFSKGYDVTEEWSTLEETLEGGGETSVIQIIYGGQYVMAVESLKVTQDLAVGDQITVPIANEESYFPAYDNDDDDWDEWDDYAYQRVIAKGTDGSTAYYTINVPDRYLGDTYSYRVRGNKIYYYIADNSDDWKYWKGISSSWSELKVVGEDTGVKDNLISADSVKAYRSGNSLVVSNPDAAEVRVYNAAGALVGRTNSTVATFNLSNGVYIVKAGTKAVKLAM